MAEVVFGAANYWGGPIVTGTQHYARCFARAGWNTAYLSDQISPLHLLRWKSRMYTRDKFRLWLRGGLRAEEGRLFAYNHLTLLPVFNAPVLRGRTAVERSLDLSVPNLQRLLEREGFVDPELLWIDHLIFEDLVGRLDPGAVVYRMADDPRLFPEANPPALLERVERLVRRADLVVVTAERLRDDLRATRDEGVLYLPNGVDYEHFAGYAGPEPADYAAIPGPRVVYAGSIEPWFDVELVAAAARARPDLSFVVIGPVRIPLGELRALPNVHILGKRSYDALPAYFAHADVGIIPFRRTPHVEAVHPIKLYEYLAAGLPVVAPAWEELRRMGSPALLTAGPAEFVEALGASIGAADEGARRRYARQNSWASRFAQVCGALGLEVGPQEDACAGS